MAQPALAGQAPAVGVVGAGQMGLAMALRLRELGFAVAVRDIDPVREALARAGGCEVAASPAELAMRSDLLVVAVVDAPQVREVLFGTAGVATAGADRRAAAVLLCSTIGADDMAAMVAECGALGLPALDAPMSGGPLRARQGTMSLMVAAPRPLFERWLPTLQAIASPVLHVGERPGDATRTKLVNNLLAAVNLAGAAEAMALASSLGLDARRTLEVIEHSSGQSWIGSDRLRRAIAGDEGVHAQLALLAKDSALALHLAANAAALPVGAAASQWFARACAQGWAARDDAQLPAFILQQGAAPRSAR